MAIAVTVAKRAQKINTRFITMEILRQTYRSIVTLVRQNETYGVNIPVTIDFENDTIRFQDYDMFTIEESENKYERLSLKVGVSIINIGKASMRIKAGLFYQWDWEYNHNEESWFHSGKFIFGVGMRNLY